MWILIRDGDRPGCVGGGDDHGCLRPGDPILSLPGQMWYEAGRPVPPGTRSCGQAGGGPIGPQEEEPGRGDRA